MALNRQNYMVPPHTRREREIAKTLGLTEAELKTLLSIHAGDLVTGGAAGDKLISQGVIEEAGINGCRRRLTTAGAALLRRARQMGY
jgi:hypothetical protein